MDKKSHVILGIHITDRLQKAGEVQKLFSEYGHSIKTRLGLHHVEEGDRVGDTGLILLEMVGEVSNAEHLLMRLNSLEKVYLALRDLQPEVTLDEPLRKRALLPLERMLALG